MVVGISTVRHAAVGIGVGEGVGAVGAVVLVAIAALLAIGLQTRVVLSANADTVADLDALLNLAADTHGRTDDLVADADGL